MPYTYGYTILDHGIGILGPYITPPPGKIPHLGLEFDQ